MKVEGDFLIFSSGKKVYAAEGMIALDTDGNILIDNDRNCLAIPELTDLEKWKLSKYMIERWVGIMDKLWARHEEAMRAEPVEAYITREHTADLLLTSENIKASNRECIYDTCGMTCGRRELTDGPRCENKACGTNDRDYKDGCALKKSGRDKCRTWLAIVAEGKE